MCEVYVEKYGGWDYCGLPGYKRDYGGGPHVWPGHDVCHMHRKMSLDDILWRRDRALIHNIGEFVEHLGIINFEWQLCQIWEHWNESHLASMKRDGRDEFWEMTFAEALGECEPAGEIEIPHSSYAEMTEWSSGDFNNFFRS